MHRFIDSDMRIQTKVALFLIALLLAPCCIGSVSAQQSDNYRNRLRNALVKVEETNLPIVFINVGGKTILRNDYILAKMKIIHNGD